MKPLLNGLAKSAARSVAARMGPQVWNRSTPGLWILMYHRVLPADDPRAHDEEPGMVVAPETLACHFRWLQEAGFDFISLTDWISRSSDPAQLPKRCCAITFDDGWRDNYEFAFPVIESFGIPATVFAVADLIGTNHGFWPNRLARLISQTDGQALTHSALEPIIGQIEQEVTGLPFREQLSVVIGRCKRYPDEDLDHQLALAEVELGVEPWESPPLMNWDQLRTLANSGLVEIGSHTCHHTRLTDALSDDQATREIVGSKTRLEAELGQPVRLFCYPNGDISAAALQLVSQTYDAAVTTRRGINSPSSPAHSLFRIGMHQDISASRQEFMARLSGWF